MSKRNRSEETSSTDPATVPGLIAVETAVRELAARFAADLKRVTDVRVLEMVDDDTSHFLLYRVLGVSDEEGRLIDVYQNKGRFLYKYAGAFL